MIIEIDGTKWNKSSGGGWTASSSKGKLLAHSTNPDLGSTENMKFISFKGIRYAISIPLLIRILHGV